MRNAFSRKQTRPDTKARNGHHFSISPGVGCTMGQGERNRMIAVRRPLDASPTPSCTTCPSSSPTDIARRRLKIFVAIHCLAILRNNGTHLRGERRRNRVLHELPRPLEPRPTRSCASGASSWMGHVKVRSAKNTLLNRCHRAVAKNRIIFAQSTRERPQNKVWCM